MDETPTNTSAAPAPEAAAPAPAPAGEKKGNTGVIIAIIIAAVLIVAGAITCVLLLTNNNKDNNGGNNGGGTGQDGGDNGGNNGGNGGNNGGGNTSKTTSIVTCIAKGDTWEYGNEFTVDNEAEQLTKMKYSLSIDDDYNPDDLTQNEQFLLMGAAMMFATFEQADDAGVKVNISDYGDSSTGAGYSGTVELIRSKLEDEDAIASFEEYDGKTAEELIELVKENDLDDIKMTCKTK